MKRQISILLVYVLTTIGAMILSSFNASALPARPEPQRLVNDLAGIFTQQQVDVLERTLVEFDDTTSNQIAVVTTRDLEGMAIADYATRIGLDWQVGTEKFDNGVVVVIKPKEARSNGQVFIAVGYGLEGAIPDAYAKRIISNIMIPHFMNDDYYGGVKEACRTIMALASGEISEMRESEDDIASVIFFFILLVLLIIIVAAANGKGNSGHGNGGRGPVIFTGPIITRGNDYGGFGGSGFGGGFGGFGGGSFGGGGAGGSW